MGRNGMDWEGNGKFLTERKGIGREIKGKEGEKLKEWERLKLMVMASYSIAID